MAAFKHETDSRFQLWSSSFRLQLHFRLKHMVLINPRSTLGWSTKRSSLYSVINVRWERQWDFFFNVAAALKTLTSSSVTRVLGLRTFFYSLCFYSRDVFHEPTRDKQSVRGPVKGLRKEHRSSRSVASIKSGLNKVTRLASCIN